MGGQAGRIGILGAAGIARMALTPAIRNAERAGLASRSAPALAGWAKDEGIPRLLNRAGFAGGSNF